MLHLHLRPITDLKKKSSINDYENSLRSELKVPCRPERVASLCLDNISASGGFQLITCVICGPDLRLLISCNVEHGWVNFGFQAFLLILIN